MEANNMKAMREALKKVLDAVKHLSRTHNDDLPEDVRAVLGGIAFDASDALAKPARNCDEERDAAEALLSRMMKEHGISIEELDDEALRWGQMESEAAQ